MYATTFRPRATSFLLALMIWGLLVVMAGCTAAIPAASAVPSAAGEPGLVDAEFYTLRFGEAGMELPAVMPSGIVPVRFETAPGVPAGAMLAVCTKG